MLHGYILLYTILQIMQIIAHCAQGSIPLYTMLQGSIPLYTMLQGYSPLYTMLQGYSPLYTMLQGYSWLKEKILSEEGRRQQTKLREVAEIADRIGCSLSQLAIGG